MSIRGRCLALERGDSREAEVKALISLLRTLHLRPNTQRDTTKLVNGRVTIEVTRGRMMSLKGGGVWPEPNTVTVTFIHSSPFANEFSLAVDFTTGK